MGTEIDIRVKQDFVTLKPQLQAPNTEDEASLFVDTVASRPQFRRPQNGLTSDIAFLEDVEENSINDATQAAILQLSNTSAKNGVNTDIISLGTPDTTLFIQGQLNILNASAFEVYQIEQQFVAGPNVGVPINLQAVLFDTLGEFNIAANAFFPLHDGLYLFKLSVDIFIDTPAPDWRVILALFVNNNERVRLVDANIPISNGGPSGLAFIQLTAGARVDARISYTNYSFSFYPGSFAARFTMVKIG